MTNLEIRTLRLHLSILGYLAFSFSSVYFGIHPWKECLLVDKVLSVTALAFILQAVLMKTSDLSSQLRAVQLLATLLFIWTSLINH